MTIKRLLLPLSLLIFSTSFYASEAKLRNKLKRKNQPCMKRYVRQTHPAPLTFQQEKDTRYALYTRKALSTVCSIDINTKKEIINKVRQKTAKKNNLKQLENEIENNNSNQEIFILE